MTASGGFGLNRTFVQLQDGARADLVPVGPDFWETIDQRSELGAGRLLMVMRQGASWTNWEMHPAGDEILYLLSGAVTMLLQDEEDGGEREISLGPGMACVIPQGVWHTARVDAPGDMLFITRGAGTQHRPRDPASGN